MGKCLRPVKEGITKKEMTGENTTCLTRGTHRTLQSQQSHMDQYGVPTQKTPSNQRADTAAWECRTHAFYFPVHMCFPTFTYLFHSIFASPSPVIPSTWNDPHKACQLIAMRSSLLVTCFIYGIYTPLFRSNAHARSEEGKRIKLTHPNSRRKCTNH